MPASPPTATSTAASGDTASWRYLLLWCTAVVATIAVFVVPALVVSLRGFTGEAALVAAAESAFTGADVTGRVADSSALAELTARWQEFHLVKAVIAGLLLLVLARLAAAARQKAEAAVRRRHRWPRLAAYGAVLTWLLGALTVLLANVQGAIAPLSSVTSFLPTGRRPDELDRVLSGIRQAVTVDPPARVDGIAGELLTDFTLYHAVLAVSAAVSGLVLTTLALRAALGRWRLRRTNRSPQPTWALQAILFSASGGFFLLLSLANASTWVDPVPALVASLGQR